MKFTILGSTGFIGAALSSYLRGKGHEVTTPDRNISSFGKENLGHVVYAIGMTGNFREHPQAAIEAHVNVLQRLMKDAHFDSWLYLSSARIYGTQPDNAEDAPLHVIPSADTLYDLSKMLGEAICLSHQNPAVRVARLSNVYGAGQSEHTFLGSILRDLKNSSSTTIGESPQSSKDYVSVEDVIRALESIALSGKERIYNIASGHATTHQVLADALKLHGYTVNFSGQGPTRALPAINIDRLKEEFGIVPKPFLDDLPSLIKL